MAASEDFLSRWSDSVWLRRFGRPGPNGPNPTAQNVMDYFAMSQFYDPECNNEKTKLQQLPPEHMDQMEGLQYMTCRIPDDSGQLFLLKKVRRQQSSSGSGMDEEVLAYYYVLDGSIYQCPNIHSIFRSRLMHAAHHIKQAFRMLKGDVLFSAPDGWTCFASAAEAKDSQLSGASATAAAQVNQSDSVQSKRLTDNVLRLAKRAATRQCAQVVGASELAAAAAAASARDEGSPRGQKRLSNSKHAPPKRTRRE